MEYFFNAWKTIKEQIENKPLLLFLDFDGTLAPIASSPANAQLPPVTLDSLKRLSEKRSCKVAVISGRELADVKQRVNLRSLVYVGNHGLEMEGPDVQLTVVASDTYSRTLQTIKAQLLAIAGGYKGALVEDKKLTLSVHFRLVDPGQISELHNKMRAALVPYVEKALVRIRTGKMVLEVRPPIEWDKGRAVSWLIDKWQALYQDDPAVPFYCGDDTTDEDAFRVLENKGITILVGAHAESAAQYYLNSQKEIDLFLSKIIELKK